MGLELRERGGPYYYQKERVGGRVVSRYVGGGLMGALAQRLDQERREERGAARERDRAALEGAQRALDELAAYGRVVDEAARVYLEGAGYRRHNRGEWRRSRMAGKRADARAIERQVTERLVETYRDGGELAKGARRALLVKAAAGDAVALEALKEGYRKEGRHFRGILDLSVQESILSLAAGKTDLGGDEFMKWAVSEDAKALERELLGESPTALERLLVARIVLGYQAVHFYEHLVFQSLGKASREQTVHFERLGHRANERYLQALKGLAVIRRLQLPAVQVNIGERQVNVAGGQAITAPCAGAWAAGNPMEGR